MWASSLQCVLLVLSTEVAISQNQEYRCVHPEMLPDSQRAVVEDDEGNPRILSNCPLPPLRPRSALIQIESVGLNPSDFKTGNAFPAPGAIIGRDFVGKIICTAPDSDTSLAPGDRVCGLVHGSNAADRGNGAFAEYVRGDIDFLLRMPASLDTEADRPKAASLGVALVTNALGLWGAEHLGLEATPDSPARARLETQNGEPQGLPVLVYGGSTATGTIAIQLLKLSGLDPIAVCSSPNFELVKSRGASGTFDRNVPAGELSAAIKAHTGGRLRHVLDCIGSPESAAICYSAMSRVGGRYTSLERVPSAVLEKRRAVRASFFHAAEGLGDSLHFHGYLEKAGSQEKRESVAKYFKMYQRLLDSGVLKPHPTQVIEPAGLESVLEGLKTLESGTVSGKKLIVTMF